MSDEVQPVVTVEKGAFYRALKHGIELWNDESTPTFRLDQRGGRDGFTRYVNSRIEGKVGEEAFSEFLQEYYGIDSSVDYRIYGDKTQTDHGDLEYIVDDDREQHPPSTEVEVKKTKPWNSWLALRKGVLDRHPEGAPVVLVKLSIEDDVELGAWEGDSWEKMCDDPMFEVRVSSFANSQFPVEAELVGVVYKGEFTEEFSQGDRLYDPETKDPVGGPLRRDNVAIPCNELVSTEERWDTVVDEITTDINVEYKELSE